MFVLDMFPYPSGVGLHVGHPLGYIATDVYARFQRMNGFNVLHAMGYDAFGLPAEQYAVQTGTHPRVTTEQNIANMRRQLRALGLGSRSAARSGHHRCPVLPLDPVDLPADLQLLVRRRRAACPSDRHAGAGVPGRSLLHSRRDSRSTTWIRSSSASSSTPTGSRTRRSRPSTGVPGLGTVLANEEVTGDGRSERGNFPVYRRPLKQWMLRITSYADRLLDDLDALDWTDSIKLMQRNWIGRSTGASVRFPVEGHEDVSIEVFTTRPDTLFGATYMVLAPEHPLVDVITANQWPDDQLTQRLREQRARRVEGPVRCDGSAARGRQPLPRLRRGQVRSRTAIGRQGEDGRLHRCVRDQPDEQRAHPDLHCRLRADGVRHRRDHGGARARRTRLRVRARVRTADRSRHRAERRVARGARRRSERHHHLVGGVRRRRRRVQLRERRGLARRPARRRSRSA